MVFPIWLFLSKYNRIFPVDFVIATLNVFTFVILFNAKFFLSISNDSLCGSIEYILPKLAFFVAISVK